MKFTAFQYMKPYRKKSILWVVFASVFSLMPLWSLLIFRLATQKPLYFDVTICTLIVSYAATLTSSILLDYHFGPVKIQETISSRSESRTKAPLMYVFVPATIILFCALIITTTAAIPTNQNIPNIPIVVSSFVIGLLSFSHAYYAKKIQYKASYKVELLNKGTNNASLIKTST